MSLIVIFLSYSVDGNLERLPCEVCLFLSPIPSICLCIEMAEVYRVETSF